MKTKDQIISKSVKFSSNRPGIYFLIFQNEIVYVGASSNTENRIYIHRRKRGIKFSSYHIEFMDGYSMDEIFEIEKEYIREFMPEHNIKDNPGAMVHKPILHQLFKKFYSSYEEISAETGYSPTTVRNVIFGTNCVAMKTKMNIEQHLLSKI